MQGRDTVTAVSIRGGDLAGDPRLERGIATRSDALFDPDVLARDLERIERFYAARGYYMARARVARVIRRDGSKVRVEIVVDPGPPVIVSEARLTGIDALPSKTVREVRSVLALKPGQRMDEALLHSGARALEQELANRGYAFVSVTEEATVSLAHRAAVIEYAVFPGPLAAFGEIEIEGLHSIEEEAVRRQLGFSKGDPFSRNALTKASRQLLSLGVLSSVEVVTDLEHPDSRTVPVRIVAQEGSARSFHLGALVELDSIRILAGGRIGWEHRNFLGGLRKLTMSVTPGALLYPLTTRDVRPRILPTVTSTLRLEQPGFLQAETTGFVQADASVFPVLYSEFAPGDRIVGFGEVRGSLGLERVFGDGWLKLRPSQNSQTNLPFMYLGDKPDGLDPAIVSFPEILAQIDLRDSTVEPRQGAYFEVAAQAAGLLAGNARDFRIRPEARLYGKLTKNWTLAFRSTVGLLFPKRCGSDRTRGCYGDSLGRAAARTVANDARTVRDQQILLFRAFYSGGATSNRGYMLREVGPHGTLGFLVPSNTNCDVPDPPQQCIRPLGGLTLWEASLEARWTLSELIGLVFFVDTSDLTRKRAYFRAAYPHMSGGAGFRLRTPVGAARFDIGARIPYMQQVGKKSLDLEERTPRKILGAPIAIHFGLGEAF